MTDADKNRPRMIEPRPTKASLARIEAWLDKQYDRDFRNVSPTVAADIAILVETYRQLTEKP